MKTTKLPLQDLGEKEASREETGVFESLQLSENKLRPRSLKEYIGQSAVAGKLEVFMAAAKQRRLPLDHVLLSGPPGLGKTTLAHIISTEMGGKLHYTAGPLLEKPVDLVALLTNLQEGDVLFIDEIHRLSTIVEESLYPAMEDYQIQVILGEGTSAQAVTVPLQKFTLVGATTQSGRLTAPMRDRFGIHFNLDFYSVEDMKKILKRSSQILKIDLDEKGLEAIARRSRGTPRIANRLLSRVRDFVEVSASAEESLSKKAKDLLNGSTLDVVERALEFLDVDLKGLQPLDRQYLNVLIKQFKGGPAGVEALAASLSEDRSTLEETVEPYLLKEGFIIRSPRGRVACDLAYNHLGLPLQKTQVEFV